MSLVDSDLLADACGLSLGMSLGISGVGLILWLFGWWSHRFWAVLLVTTVAGVFGLTHANTLPSPLLSALLIALVAGMLALALVRIATFLAAGLTGLLLAQEFFPTLQQQVLVFLIVGLVCLFLYRLCLMALTSLGGALFMTYAGLILFHRFGGIDAVAWAEQNGLLLNAVVGLLALLGFGFQFYQHRRSVRQQREQDSEDERGSILSLNRLLGKRRAA